MAVGIERSINATDCRSPGLSMVVAAKRVVSLAEVGYESVYFGNGGRIFCRNSPHLATSLRSRDSAGSFGGIGKAGCSESATAKLAGFPDYDCYFCKWSGVGGVWVLSILGCGGFRGRGGRGDKLFEHPVTLSPRHRVTVSPRLSPFPILHF